MNEGVKMFQFIVQNISIILLQGHMCSYVLDRAGRLHSPVLSMAPHPGAVFIAHFPCVTACPLVIFFEDPQIWWEFSNVVTVNQ